MKISFWDILSILTLLALCIMGVFFLQIFINPDSSFNPFPPPTLPAPIILPSATEPPQRMPPTWTPVVPNDVGPTLRPSSTAAPTLTLAVLPTATKVPTATFTPRPTSSTQGYSCTMISQIPASDATLSPSILFDGNFTLRNTSDTVWDYGNIDVRYKGGDHLHSGSDVYDLAHSVNSGDTITIVIPMVSPSTPGTYTTTWALVEGGTTRCSWNFQIQVK